MAWNGFRQGCGYLYANTHQRTWKMSKIIKNKNIIEKSEGKEAKDSWENAGTAECTFNFLQTTEGVSTRIYPWLSQQLAEVHGPKTKTEDFLATLIKNSIKSPTWKRLGRQSSVGQKKLSVGTSWKLLAWFTSHPSHPSHLFIKKVKH